jgi:hypothetical protein
MIFHNFRRGYLTVLLGVLASDSNGDFANLQITPQD